MNPSMKTKKTADALEILAAQVAAKLGKTYGTGWKKGADGRYYAVIGEWSLNFNRVYGGYAIEEIANDAGGVKRPVCSLRVSRRDMFNLLNALNGTLPEVK